MKIKIKSAFTLAETLITLAIIGTIASVAIPSVISNTQQLEYKTGLKKAVSVLNSAILVNSTSGLGTPYTNTNLYEYLKANMKVMKVVDAKTEDYLIGGATSGTSRNAAFYTIDGMRFEVNASSSTGNDNIVLYENKDIKVCTKNAVGSATSTGTCGGCGSLGLHSNPNKTTKPPCLVFVDVNGDRKPNPANANCRTTSSDRSCANKNVRKYADPKTGRLTDLVGIMITDKEAIPYGIAAQKAMYEAR